MPEGSTWKAAYRLARIGARLVAMRALVLLAAALYEYISAWRDARELKQIGRSVDIGGRTLNIHCGGGVIAASWSRAIGLTPGMFL